MRSIRLICLILLFIPINVLAQNIAELTEIHDTVMSEDQRNTGINFELAAVPEYDENAVSLTILSVAGTNSKADIMRVILQTLEKFDEEKVEPSIFILSCDGEEKLLFEGSIIPTIALNYRAGKPAPAWRLMVENSTKADGSKFSLPAGLLPRTTAAMNVADLMIPKTITTTSDETISDKPADPEALPDLSSPIPMGTKYEKAVEFAKQRAILAGCPAEIIEASAYKADRYDRMVKIKFKNTGSKTISAYKVIYYFFNDFGDYIDSGRGIAQNQNIKPNKDETAMWEHYEDTATKAVFELYEILYTDGSTWKFGE